MTAFDTRQELFREILRSAGEARLAVNGASMLPAIWPGDVVTVRAFEVADLRPGRIVLFPRENLVVSHRILAVRPDGTIITGGDSAPRRDPPISPADIIGRVVAIERNGRRISPEQSTWQRCVACILRHSDFCTRVLLFLHHRSRPTPNSEVAWAS